MVETLQATHESLATMNETQLSLNVVWQHHDEASLVE